MRGESVLGEVRGELTRGRGERKVPVEVVDAWRRFFTGAAGVALVAWVMDGVEEELEAVSRACLTDEEGRGKAIQKQAAALGVQAMWERVMEKIEEEGSAL